LRSAAIRSGLAKDGDADLIALRGFIGVQRPYRRATPRPSRPNRHRLGHL